MLTVLTRSIFTFTVATVPLGIARGAIDDFVNLASSANGAATVFRSLSAS